MRDLTVTCDLCGRRIADDSKTPFGWAIYDKRVQEGTGPVTLDFHRDCIDALIRQRDERIKGLSNES
jgi:hypothetical protein